MSTVYFLLPYMPFEPVGGVKTVFDYAMRINELAGKTRAAILTDSKYILAWLPPEYAKIPSFLTTKTVNSDDTVVIPEVSIEAAKKYSKVARKILLVLNWQYFDQNLRTLNLKKLGYTEILTNSEYSKTFLEKKKLGIPVKHIPQYINATAYASKTPINERSKHSIVMLNRKNTHHIPPILEFLRLVRHTVTLANNIRPEEIAQILGKHQIFVNLGYPEGFCRPAAEAMAAGCIVVGFTGGGGKDFMHHMKTAYVAEDGNEKELLEHLNTVIHFTDTQREQISKAARATISAKYTKRAQAQELYTIFHNEIKKAYTKARIDAMYAKSEPKHTGRPVKMLKVAGANDKTQEVLEYQLFQERQQTLELKRSKMYRFWQRYTHARDSVKRALSFS